MQTVQNHQEIIDNINTFQGYSKSLLPLEKTFFYDLTKRGRCFVVSGKCDNISFTPSRFVGYVNNNITNHNSNKFKDGKETNPAITIILGNLITSDDSPYDSLLDEFNKFCKLKKVAPYNVEHKFWKI